MEIIFIILISIIIFLLLIDYTSYNAESFDVDINYQLPKIVYLYWDDDNNKLINSHINLLRRKIPKDWAVIILNKKNVHNYVDADFISRHSDMDSTKFSDFLRLELLYRNGGIWIDASILIIDFSFISKYYDEMIEYKYDICMYELKEFTLNPKTPYLENWFIMAPRNSKLIKDLYTEFEYARMTGYLNYKQNTLKPSGVNLTKTITYDNENVYLLQHAIINYLMHKGNIYNINIKQANKSMFKIHISNQWNDKQIMEYIMKGGKKLLNSDNYYAVKLVKSNRNEIVNEEKYIHLIDEL